MYSKQLKSLRYYHDNKKKFNKLYGYQIKKMVAPENVGYCSFIFQEFIKQWDNEELPSVQDFANFYFSYTKEKDKRYCGRTIEEFTKLSEKYYNLCDDISLYPEQCFDDLVNHVIIETFDGQIREIILKKEYAKKGYVLEQTSGEWDHEYGVDFIIKDKSGIIKGYIQCKPISFFSSTANNSCVSDRKMVFKKEEKKKQMCEDRNIPYYPTKFVIYNALYPNKWCSIDKKRGFLAEELMNEDGSMKIDIKKFKYS